MGVSLFLCLPCVRSVAPSRAFPQARLGNLFSFVSSVSLLMLAVHLALPGGSVPATAVRAGSKHSSFRNLVYLDNWLGLR